MKTLLLLIVSLVVVTHALAETPTQNLARAIARAEGFYSKGSKPNRYCNPGDIRASRGVSYPGQRGIDRQGYVIFKNDRAGFAALEDQISRIIDGTSRFYTVNLTLKELSKKYATSPTWCVNVAKNLHTPPNTPLFLILDTPPQVAFKTGTAALDFLQEK